MRRPDKLTPIQGFPDYSITKDGRVWSWFRNRWLKTKPGANGYPKIGLYTKGSSHSKDFSVHVLVLLTFVGPCPPGMEACHRDGNKTNNHINNLRWDTRSENRYDSIRQGHKFEVNFGSNPRTVRGEENGLSKLKSQDVLCIRKRCADGETQRVVALDYRVDTSNISRIVRRETWTHI